MLRKYLVVALLITGAPAPVLAYSERIKTCAELYVMRNRFFHEKGLCFTRPGAQNIFMDNRLRCDPSLHAEDIPITERQRQALRRIREAEARLACPRP